MDQLLHDAWHNHDQFALSLTKWLPSNAGKTVTNRLVNHQNRAAQSLGITPSMLIDQVTAHRRAGHNLHDAINLTLTKQPMHDLPPW